MRLVGYALRRRRPRDDGHRPDPGDREGPGQAGLTIDDIGLFEINEAFAVQVLAFLDHFGIADDDPRVNPYGGAIAIGHPLASSGVRLMTQLARQFAEHPEVRYGLTTMCVGLGMGGTVIWENPHTCDGSSRASTARDGASSSPLTRSSPQRCCVRVRRGCPRRPATLALITLDNGRDHTRPNTFGPGGLASLDAAIDEVAAHAPRVAAIAVTGKPFIFAVGADLSGMPQITDREPGAGASAGSATGCSAGWATARVPTFAFVNGAGDGRRPGNRRCTATTGRISPATPALALPEVFLGLLPGWGGTQLLPRLIGAAERGHRDHRERAQPEPDAQAGEARRLGHRRRAAGRRRLPGAVAALGRAAC